MTNEEKLMEAVRNNKVEEAKEIITSTTDPTIDINKLHMNGYTPLHEAALQGNVVMVKLLIDYNANVDLKTKWGDTALILATKVGKLEAVKILCEAKANVNIGSPQGALAISYKNGFNEINYLLEDYGAQDTDGRLSNFKRRIHSKRMDDEREKERKMQEDQRLRELSLTRRGKVEDKTNIGLMITRPPRKGLE